MIDDDEEPTPWTPEGAARLRAAAAEVAVAVVAHAEAVTAVARDAAVVRVFEATDDLVPALLAYADAQLDYCGNGFPFGVLHQFADPDDGEEEADEPEPVAGVSVLQRHDYQVTDEPAVMSAGREAYLTVRPDDDEAAAAADVTHLGRALYQIAHADGWDGLDRVEGLRATGGAVVVARSDELLGPDEGEWPEDLFEGDGELLYQQSDVYAD